MTSSVASGLKAFADDNRIHTTVFRVYRELDQIAWTELLRRCLAPEIDLCTPSFAFLAMWVAT